MLKNTRFLPQMASNLFFSRALSVLEPWRLLCDPVFLGLDNIPGERPVLFVGNHTLGGLLDAPLMLQGLYQQRNLRVRTMGDHAHFLVPGWGRLLQSLGVVDGNRDNCRALMQAGENILVYPGGGREVLKRKGEKYTLIWKQRYGFAKMALEQNYTVVPFAALGAEECFDIIYDADQLLATRTGKLIKKLGMPDKFIPSLVHGVGPSLIPRPQRMYFKFGEPIDSELFRQSEEGAVPLRERCQKNIEKMLVELLEYRHLDPAKALQVRLAAQFK